MLTADITSIPRPDTYPTVLAHLGVVDGTEVTVPFRDARTAKTTINMEDDAAVAVCDWGAWRDKTLEVALRVRYVHPLGKKVIFHGPIHTPDFDYDDGVITINAHGPELRMKSAFVQMGDWAIDPGITMDGRGVRQIVELAQNRENQDALNWPSLGIISGIDTALVRHVAENSPYTFHKLNRGDQLFQTLVDAGKNLLFPDWEIEPFETDPAAVAVGTTSDLADHGFGANGTTDFSLAVSRTGVIQNVRIDAFIQHGRPSDLKIDVVHPDGTTVRLYDGDRDRKQSAITTTAFGTAENAMASWGDLGAWQYGSFLKASVFPKTGNLHSEELLYPALADKSPNGTWKLRIINSGGTAGTVGGWAVKLALPEPAYARINTWDKPPDEAPPIDAVFHRGYGRHTLESLKVSPLGEQVINQQIYLKDDAETIVRVNDAARADIGTYQAFESAEQNDTDEVLKARADEMVKAYGRPAPALTMKPVDDGGQPKLPRFLIDYKPGSYVRVSGKKGNSRHRIIARVTEGTVRQNGDLVETDTTVVPYVGTGSEMSDGDPA